MAIVVKSYTVPACHHHTLQLTFRYPFDNDLAVTNKPLRSNETKTWKEDPIVVL